MKTWHGNTMSDSMINFEKNEKNLGEIKKSAKEMFDHYQSLKEAGFSEKMALELVRSVLLERMRENREREATGANFAGEQKLSYSTDTEADRDA